MTDQKKLNHWVRKHTVESALLYFAGHTYRAIGEKLGFSDWTVRERLKRDGLQALHDPVQIAALATELAQFKALETLAFAVAGSVEMKRACDLLGLLGKGGRSAVDGKTDEESGVKSLKQIKEMSDEDLVAYVESLVPGLETKACAGDDEAAGGTGGAIPVPDHRACGADTARARDRLAKLALPGWPGGGEDAGGRRMGAVCGELLRGGARGAGCADAARCAGGDD